MIEKRLGISFFLIVPMFLILACSDYKDMYQDAYASMWDDESVDVVSSSSISNSNKEPEDEESSSEKKSSSNSNKKNSSSSKAKSSSSSVVKSSSSVKNSSSSKKSSSSQKPNQYVSSSSVYQTSSATPTLGSDFGTCAPARTPIAKGDTVSWVLKAKDPTLLMNASTSWTMVGGTPDAVNAVKGMGGRTAQTKYAASGDYVATAQVTVGAANYNIKCDPLHVNGDPITGCTCGTAATSVDYTATPGVTWAVTGCATGAGIDLAYEWDGLAGETTYTKMFDATHPGYTPKLVVKSTDNSMLEVACPTVKVTKGPEYIFEINDKIPLESQEIKNGGCISIVGRWNNSIYRPTLSVYCSMKATTSPVSFEMTYGTKVYKEKSYSSWGFSLVGGEIDQLKDGEISIDNICVQFTGAETVECRLQ